MSLDKFYTIHKMSLDKFYTTIKNADFVIDRVKEHTGFDFDFMIEPSAGDGIFLERFKNKIVSTSVGIYL